jgi:hypothetical protein
MLLWGWLAPVTDAANGLVCTLFPEDAASIDGRPKGAEAQALPATYLALSFTQSVKTSSLTLK